MSLSLSDRSLVNLGCEVFCVQISREGNYVAAGLGDGTIKVLSLLDGAVLYTLHPPNKSDIALPTTCIRWRPPTSSTATKHILLSGHADGNVYHWHVTSSQLLHTINEQDNQVYALDYNRDGSMFATAGKDLTIRVYDEQTKTLLVSLKRGIGRSLFGHTNRIFSLKFSPIDPSIIYSCGWDNNLITWDLRLGSALRSVHGPHACGDALQVSGETGHLLTGSWRHDEQLQLWTSNGELIKTIDVDCDQSIGVSSSVDSHCLVYGCCFMRNSSVIAAGGSGNNIVRLINIENGQFLGTFHFKSAVYSVDANADDVLVIGTGDGTVRILHSLAADQSTVTRSTVRPQSALESARKESNVIDSPGGVRWNKVMARPILNKN
ncbi:hypothetical protein RCL1_004167 [Eukaryota sp. TZLM3-RCL]